jgi:MFS family permease
MEPSDGRDKVLGRADGLWRESDFLKLWSAQAISALGSRITRTALPILAVVTIGASVDEIAVLSALAVAPGLLIGLAMGGRVDRAAKKPLLIGSDLIRAGLLLTVPLAAWRGCLNMPQLYFVTALCGAATTLFQIADNAYLPMLIGKERLVEGNAKLESTEAVAEIAGPGLGGVLVQWVTAPLAILLDAFSFLASALLLVTIGRGGSPAPGAIDGDRPTMLRDLRIGFQATCRHPLVRALFLVEAVSALTGGFLMSLYTIYALKTLHLSPATLGLVIGVGGIGALAGTLFADRVSRRLGLGSALIVCLAGSRLANLLIPMARGPQWLGVSCLVGQQLLGDALFMCYYVLANSLRQTVLPQEILGRSNAIFHVAAGVLLPLGALIAGPIATATDARTALWISVLIGLLSPALLWFSAIRRVGPLSPPDSNWNADSVV